MKIEWQRFPKQLKYWVKHCSINALPSFIIACAYLELWKQPEAVVAMLLAVATFVLVYSVVTSLEGPFSNRESLMSRALRRGTLIRSVVSAVSLPLLIPDVQLILFVPDFWAGWAAVAIMNGLSDLLGVPGAVGGTKLGSNFGNFQIYLTTLLEGLIISVALLMISFFSLLIMQGKARRRGVA